MNSMGLAPDDRERALRLSHRLVALHAGGIALLIAVVLSTAFWMSAEQNRLAVRSSEELVRNAVTSLRTRVYTLVRDYSIWDEGYSAVLADDRAWLYSNIGSSVIEIGTFDVAIIAVPGSTPFGWVSGSPPEGEVDILPAALLKPILELVEAAEKGTVATRTLIAEFDGSPWVFAIARMTPVDGAPSGVRPAELPRQIHGVRLTQERLSQIGQDILGADISLAETVLPGQASVSLVNHEGAVLASLVWDAPHPGASILRMVAIPLALALGVVAIISAISSFVAVRSAQELERALQAAKAADRSKTEFLSNVSHELRTPMNGVLGATQLLQTTELDAEQKELVAVLLASANAQMALISDLLDLSRLDSGAERLQSHPFEPAAVLREVAEMMQVAASAKRIRLELDCGDLEGLNVRGDAQAFRQVVTNLIGNAVKFTERGSVDVRASVDADRTGVSVGVADNGPGIPEAALPRIFERFYQVDSSMSRSTEGTGLGLAISRKLAHTMGGDIEVSSRPGRGSTFRFTARFHSLSGAAEARDAA